MPPAILGMSWLGAIPAPMVTGEQPLPGTVNYFIGNDPTQWHTNIPTYQQVRYHNVYPGVDLVYYGKQGQLEYDFVVAPGANPAAIQLGFTGASGIGVDLQGDLSLTLSGGALQQAKPLIYQTVHGARQPVAGGYTLTASGHAGFVLGAYNPHLPLVIDPVYKFSTFYGTSGDDQGYGIATDASGNTYITGAFGNAVYPYAFVSKFNASGSTLIYSTVLGGLDTTIGRGIAVDSSGDAYITGNTTSPDFPTTSWSPQPTVGPGYYAFITSLSPAGNTLDYSTYLGGGFDWGQGIAVDASGAAYVAGYTGASTFPTTPGALQTTSGGLDDAFITKINAAGTAYVYSTYLGGSANDLANGIAVDASGAAYVTGYTASTNFPTVNPLQATNHGGFGYNSDIFVSKLNAAGSALVYSTYLGGSLDDAAIAIAVDTSGCAYVTGWTRSTDFPLANALYSTYPTGGNGFVTKLNAAGSALVYSTYFPGGILGGVGGIAADGSGDAYVTGGTYSTNFPLVHPLQAYLDDVGNPNASNAFVSELNAAGSALLFSTYLGGNGASGDSGSAIAIDGSGPMYITGTTSATNFPTANALYPSFQGGQSDAFVTKILNVIPVTTTGVFRPSNGNLYLKNSNSTGYADIALDYGLPGDKPVTGDWTRKGYKSIGVYRNGTFYLRNSNTTGYADLVVPFGANGDLPVAGDWTGKGYDSIGVYRPSTQTFYLRNTNTPGPADITITFGISGDVPIVGDWTGMGIDTIGIFRPSNGNVYLRNSNTTGPGDIVFDFGIAGDKPVVGDWDGNGTDTIGIDRNGVFYLRNSNTTGPADLSFALGISGDVPIAGLWLALPGSPPPAHQPDSPATHQPSTPAAAPTRRGKTP